jgi:hypothetical protein
LRRTAGEWTDARLDALALSLEPVPTKVAALTEAVEHLDGLVTMLQPLPSQVAVLTALIERLAEDNRALHEELAATQRHLTQIAWGLVVALLGATAAIIGALL